MSRVTCQGGVAPNGGLIVLAANPVTVVHQIVALAVRHRMPAVYPYRYFAANGGPSI